MAVIEKFLLEKKEIAESALARELAEFLLEFLPFEFSTLEAHGLDASYINAYGPAVANASEETIRSVITSVYPTPDNLVFAIIGDADVIREAVARYGTITEIALTDPRFLPPPP